ncbi:MAG: tetratricopeptide repeat protein [Flavobacteriales bacterium]|nr:tetratricopeptide repeat protein [Flavobacteriales bacterium]
MRTRQAEPEKEAPTAAVTAAWIVRPPLDAGSGPVEARRWPALVAISVYVLASLIYGLMSEAPWDDDCVTRYFNALRAWSEPAQFFSIWNRPLFMLLFAPTAWIGKTAMMVEMVALGALAGWLLYRTLEKLGARHAWMVLPLLFFQTFYFSVSRNFLTEPLAVALICAGLYALVHRRFGWFALAGGLLPLARLELAALLPLWALVVVMQRQWLSLLWLGVPVMLLALGGALVKPDAGLLWLMDETVGREGDNRYGHRDVWHYFQRYAFVVGPVLFYFLAIGAVERLARWRVDTMVVVQGLLMFALYVVFSWKLDVGNAAGFLRNLIPLTPLVAVWVQAWLLAIGRPAGLPDRATPATIAAAEKQTGKHAKGKAKPRPVATPAKQRWPWWPTVRVHLISLAAVVLIHIYYSVVLENHHKLVREPDPANLVLAGALAALLVLGTLLFCRRRVPMLLRNSLLVLVGVLMLGFTLHRERPNAHLSPERKGITELSRLYKDSYLRQYPLYANHTWFFWPDDLGYPGPNYRTLTKAAIQAAKPHAVFLWENHYAHRLSGDVSERWIKGRKDLVKLAELVSSDYRLSAYLFQKVDTAANDADLLRAEFLVQHPGFLPGYHARAEYLNDRGDFTGSLTMADTMMRLDSTNVQSHLMRAQALYQLGRHQEAVGQYERLLRLDSNYYMAHYNMGSCYLREGSARTAIAHYQRAATRSPKMYQAQDGIGSAHYQLKEYDQAAQAYTRAMRLKPRISAHYFNRANCYYQMNALDNALADYDLALKLDPRSALAMGNKGMTLMRLKRTAEACDVLRQAKAHGFQGADQALTAYCGGG